MSKWLEAKKIKGKFYIDSSDFSNIVKEYSDKIDELEEENRKLKESLDIATKCSSKEEDGIIRLSEENRLLKNEIAWLKDHTKYNGITEEYYIDGTMTATEAKLRLEQARQNQIYVSNLEEENRNLKSELSKFRDSFKKYRDYEKEELAESCYDLARENQKLKEEIGKLVMNGK